MSAWEELAISRRIHAVSVDRTQELGSLCVCRREHDCLCVSQLKKRFC